MAKKVTVTLIDDLDQDARADETVDFALDGVQYEIDLSATNAVKLREDLDSWISHARKVSGRRKVRAAGASTKLRGASASREETAAIRDWARENGLQVSARGRISADVVEAYNAAS